MIVDYAALADYATDRGGAVTACGLGINRLTVKQVPVSHPQLFLVAQMRDNLERVGNCPVQVSLKSPQGEILTQIHGQLQFSATDDQESVGRIVLGFYSVQFPTYGTYEFRVNVAKDETILLPFQVRPPQD